MIGETEEGEKYVLYSHPADRPGPDNVPQQRRYQYDMYTACPGKEWPIYANNKEVGRYKSEAVGILDGDGEQDDSGFAKADRESHFPSDVLEKALTFRSADGQASVAADIVRIQKAIEAGGGNAKVDATVHGIVAASSLQRGLLAAEPMRGRYLAALKAGKCKKITFPSDDDLNLDALNDVLDVLDEQSLEELVIGCGDMEHLPERVTLFTKLRVLDLRENYSLQTLPAALGKCTELRWLALGGENLQGLPDLSMCPRLEVTLAGGFIELDAFDGLIPVWEGGGRIACARPEPRSARSGRSGSGSGSGSARSAGSNA